MKGLQQLFRSLRDLGVDPSMSLYRQKITRIFNVLCLSGLLAALIQFVGYYTIDPVAAWCHFAWGKVVLLCLILHPHVGFKRLRVLLCTAVFLCGGYASARLGQETYPHFGVLGIYIAIFIFFDLRKEWGYLLFYFALTVALIVIIDSNYFKVADFPAEVIAPARLTTLIGTLVFISSEIILLMYASWFNENSVSEALRRSNEELQQLNKEKTVLLQEIHHRVKNNFQIISSLLKLQASEIRDQKVEYAFDEAIQRISAFSQLHEHLYKSGSLSKVNLQDYFSRLASSIIEQQRNDKHVKAEIQGEVILINTDCIVPLALLFNELLSNSLKHAFQNKTGGVIRVQLNRTESGAFSFIYSDDGEWREPREDYSFGLELIDTLTNQLDGSFTRSITEAGTNYQFTLQFPDNCL